VDICSEVCSHQKSSKNAVKVIRKATEEDIKKFQWLREKEIKAYDLCLKRIKARQLPMKLVRVRYFFNEKKGIFYYTADGRIDFALSALRKNLNVNLLVSSFFSNFMERENV